MRGILCYVITRRRKEEEIRARCDESLKNGVEKAAEVMGVDKSDVVRMACIQFLQQFKFQNATAQAQP